MTKNKNPSPMSKPPGAQVKPRLYKFQSLWYCRSTACLLTGLGFTKEDAYREWVNRNTPKAIELGACA